MPEMSYPKEIIKELIEGNLPWHQLKSIISGYKDDDRFDKYIEVLQGKVPWQEKILLPLTDELYIVQKGNDRIVKCNCGYEFGDYRENWKLKALIHVRDTEEELDEIYPYPSKPDPEYCEMREYYCPGCGAQLEVDSVPFGYPAVFDFLPDLDIFYSQWLNRPLGFKIDSVDLSYELTRRWAEEGLEPPVEPEREPPRKAEGKPPREPEKEPPKKAEEEPPKKAEEKPPKKAEEKPPREPEKEPPRKAEEKPPREPEREPSRKAEEKPPREPEREPSRKAEEKPPVEPVREPSRKAEEKPPVEPEKEPPRKAGKKPVKKPDKKSGKKADKETVEKKPQPKGRKKSK